LTLSFLPNYGPGVDSASNKNVYQRYFLGDKGGRCVGLETLPPSCADCLEIWEPQPSGTLRVCPGLYRDCFAFCFIDKTSERDSVPADGYFLTVYENINGQEEFYQQPPGLQGAMFAYQKSRSC
jgi:hypothetical protein